MTRFNIDVLVYVLYQFSREKQEDFAKRLGMSQGNVSKYLKKANNPQEATTRWSKMLETQKLLELFDSYSKRYSSEREIVSILLRHISECGISTRKCWDGFVQENGAKAQRAVRFINYLIREAKKNTVSTVKKVDKSKAVSTGNAPYLSCKALPSSRSYISADPVRDASFSKLMGQLQSGNPIFVSGIGGIGKSEFVLNSLARLERDGYRTYQTEFKGTLLDTILLLEFQGVEPGKKAEDYPNEGEIDAAYKRRMNLLRAQDEKTILLIDNFDAPDMKTYDLLLQDGSESPVYTDIKSLRMHIIFTTRYTDFFDEDPILIEALSKETLRQIVLRYRPDITSEEDVQNVDLILEHIEDHTYTADLIGRTLHANVQLSVTDVLHTLQNKHLGDQSWDSTRSSYRTDRNERQILDHLIGVFSVAGLSELHKRLLCCLSILPIGGASIDGIRNHMVRMIDADQRAISCAQDFYEQVALELPKKLNSWESVKDALDDLCKGGWLQQRGTTIDMHRLMRLVCWNCEETTIQWEHIKNFANSLAYDSEELLRQPISNDVFPYFVENECMMLSICDRIYPEAEDAPMWDDVLSHMARVCAESCEVDGLYTRAMWLWLKFTKYCLLQEKQRDFPNAELCEKSIANPDTLWKSSTFKIERKVRNQFNFDSTVKTRRHYMRTTHADGSSEVVEVLLSFKMNDTGKEYVVYASPNAPADENGDIDASISQVVRNSNDVVLTGDFSEYEYQQVLKVLDEWGTPTDAKKKNVVDQVLNADDHNVRLQLARAFSHMAKIDAILGHSHENLKKLTMSIVYYTSVDKDCLELGYVYQQRALCFDRYNELDRAERDFREARRIFRMHGISKEAPGIMRKKLVTLENGKRGWKYVVNSDTPMYEWEKLQTTAKSLIEAGYVSEGINNYREALQSLQQRFGAETVYSYSLYRALGDAYYSAKQYDEALTEYYKAVKLRDRYHLYEGMNTKTCIALTLWRQGKDAESVQFSLEALTEVEKAHSQDSYFSHSQIIRDNYLYLLLVLYNGNATVEDAYSRATKCSFLEDDMSIDDQRIIQEAFVQLRERILGKCHPVISDDYDKLSDLFKRTSDRYVHLAKECDQNGESNVGDRDAYMRIALDCMDRAIDYAELANKAIQKKLDE